MSSILYFNSKRQLYQRFINLSRYRCVLFRHNFLATASSVSDEHNYVRMSPLEHVLLRPGMYVGQIDPSREETWIYNEKKFCMEKTKLFVSPALIKVRILL